MSRRETGEGSQPRATEQVEQTPTASSHETPLMRDVLRHPHAFGAAALPDTFDPGATPLERRGTKRSAEQVSPSSPSAVVPESEPKKQRISEEKRQIRALGIRAQALLEMGSYSEEANAIRSKAMKQHWQEGTGPASEMARAVRNAALRTPEYREARMEAHLDKQAKARTDVFSPEELAAANRAANQALGSDKSYAWMNQSGLAKQR